MEMWRITLALFLIVSSVIWFIGPSFPLAFILTGVLAILAAAFLIINQ